MRPSTLITGAGGFVGPFLADLLLRQGRLPVCQVQDSAQFPADFRGRVGRSLPEDVPVLTADLRDPHSLAGLFRSSDFDSIVHLAGMSFLPDCWKRPDLALEINALGTVRLLEAARTAGWSGKFLLVSSGQVYAGPADGRLPLTEESPTASENPYSASKLAAETFASFYASKSIELIIARPFNHIGPGQGQQFVVPSFLLRIRAARENGAEFMTVGDLDSGRDFSDVRDVVEAYRILLERGRPGVYNICSGKAVTIRELLETAQDIAGVRLDFRVNRELLRPEGPSIRFGTARPLEDLGWRPAFSLRDSLRDAWSRIETAGGEAA